MVVWYNSSNMRGYKIPQQVAGMRIVYVCPDCYGLVMFPMIPPNGTNKKPPMAKCSKCFKTCQNIVGINFGVADEQEKRLQVCAGGEGRGLDASLEPHQGEATEDV